MTPPRVAVITPVAGRAAHLRRQQDGLAADPPWLQVVVAMDEAPFPPERRSWPTLGVRCPAGPDGLPVAAARNRGAATALAEGAEILVFLDVDCIPGPSLVHAYVAAVTGRPRTLACGAVTYLPPPAPGGYPAVQGLAALADPHPARPVPADGLRVEPRLDLFWSLSFALDAPSWRRSGGFDDGYAGYGAEDTDFALRAGAAGLELVWTAGAECYHQWHPTARSDPGRAGEIVRNANRFRQRHGYWPMAPWLEDLDRAGVVRFDPRRDRLAVAVEPQEPPT